MKGKSIRTKMPRGPGIRPMCRRRRQVAPCIIFVFFQETGCNCQEMLIWLKECVLKFSNWILTSIVLKEYRVAAFRLAFIGKYIYDLKKVNDKSYSS